MLLVTAIQPETQLHATPLANVADESSSEYEVGEATEMLKNSVLNLKIDDNKDNFKAQAGKILTGLLESRLKEKQLLSEHPVTITTVDGPKAINGGTCNAIDKNACEKLPESASLNYSANKPSLNATIKSVDVPSTIPTSPSSDFPPPPPPPQSEPSDHIDLNIASNKNAPITINQSQINETELNQSANSKNTIVDGFSAKANPIHSKYQHQAHGQHQFTNGHGSSNVFQNKCIKPELTTHARDRRSYIGNDNLSQNRFLNHNNNRITSSTTEIVSGLQDGKHPVCSVCHVRICR